jgi:hypothetical protein
MQPAGRINRPDIWPKDGFLSIDLVMHSKALLERREIVAEMEHNDVLVFIYNVRDDTYVIAFGANTPPGLSPSHVGRRRDVDLDIRAHAPRLSRAEAVEDAISERPRQVPLRLCSQLKSMPPGSASISAVLIGCAQARHPLSRLSSQNSRG